MDATEGRVGKEALGLDDEIYADDENLTPTEAKLWRT